MDQPSLFATKLRDWRARTGRHGRMTQEGLAERLGVSVDAIGKYERSVSFIRGDLEHRLAERLGWSSAEIAACREDWHARQKAPDPGRYTLLDEQAVTTSFGGSWNRAIRAAIDMADRELGALPDEMAANETVFRPIYDAFRDHWAVVVQGDRPVAKWGLPFLRPEDEALFRAGKLIESNLRVEHLHRPILPGHYYGYCPALIICPRHEAASPLLLSSFVRFLEKMAARDVLLRGIGTVSVSPGGAQICRDLGMAHICQHVLDPAYGVWEMSGAAIARSVFTRRSPRLRRRYSEAFPG